MTRDPDAAREAVQRLHVLYAASLDDRLAKVTSALEAARSGDSASLEAAWQAAHALQGSAGSYGFARLSEHVGHVAAHVLDALENRAPLDASAWALIDDEMRAARKAAAENRR